MASITEPTRAQAPPPSAPTPNRVLAAIHNLPRRMRSGTLRNTTNPAMPTAAPPPVPQRPQSTRARTQGKENAPPVASSEAPPRRRRPAPLLPKEKWAPRDGHIVIKVWVPTTDDIWKVRVPVGEGLAPFRARVAAKVGFDVAFAAVVDGHLRAVADEDAFRRWAAGRVRGGRNTLLTAHRLELL
ncbi:hypothetical protein C2E23DRAFT_921272 [Lenzites betulinus]|nr:hypothetical protein C2E23DRAFT_921272 [Lenzites betulinus]